MKPHRKKFNPYSTQSRTKALEMEEEAVRMIRLKQLKQPMETETIIICPHCGSNNVGAWGICPHCGSNNVGAWGPDADKCFDCEMTWSV